MLSIFRGAAMDGAAVVDCAHREVVGYEPALRGWAKEAERAVEAACLACFGTLRLTAPVSLSAATAA